MLLDVPVGNDVFFTYPTPILHRDWPGVAELNAGLKRILLAREQAAPEFRGKGLRRSNLGGWRSEPDLLDWPEPEVKRLKQMILEGVGTLQQLALGPGAQGRRLRIEHQLAAWANVNRRGAYNIVHNHPGQHWSGVYYVEADPPEPDQPYNGVIEFHDPRPAAPAMPIPGFPFGQMHLVQPRPGLMLAFPSWHQHMVHPYQGDGVRISIAFNVRVTSFQVVGDSRP